MIETVNQPVEAREPTSITSTIRVLCTQHQMLREVSYRLHGMTDRLEGPTPEAVEETPEPTTEGSYIDCLNQIAEVNRIFHERIVDQLSQLERHI